MTNLGILPYNSKPLHLFIPAGEPTCTYRAFFLFLVPVLGNDRFAGRIDHRCQSAAISAMDEKIVHARFLVDDDDSLRCKADSFLFFNVKSIFGHSMKN